MTSITHLAPVCRDHRRMSMIEFRPRINALFCTTAAGTLDAVARSLAEKAGLNWDLLHDHPGFEKNRWRDAAERQARTRT